MATRAVRALAVIAAVAALQAPPALAADWGSPYELIPESAGSFEPVITSDVDGDLLMVYETYRRHGLYGPKARTRDAGGTWGPVHDLHVVRDPSPVSFYLARLELSEHGAAIVGWERDTLNARSDWITVYRPGRGFGSPEPIADAATRTRLRPFGWAAMGPDGHGVALYGDERGMSARRLARGAMRLGGPERLAGPSGEVQLDMVRLAVARGGGVVAAWATIRARRCHLHVATSAGPRRPWRVRRLSAPYECGATPALAVNRSGAAVLVWRARGGGVRAAAGSAAAGLGRPRRLSAGGARYAAAIDAGGRATVAFAEMAGGGPHLVVATRPAGGEFGPLDELRRGRVGPGIPEVRANRAGDVAVRWRAGLRDWIATRARDGRSFSPPGLLTGRRTLFQPTPFVLDEQGFAVAAWHEPRRRRIRAAVWRAGAAVSGRTVLGATTCEQSPRVAGSPAGHVLVSWYGACGAGAHSEVWAAVRQPGSLIGPAQEISEPEDLLFCGPQLAIDSHGRGIVAWCSGDRTIRAADLSP
jgi:hypothetical protein